MVKKSRLGNDPFAFISQYEAEKVPQEQEQEKKLQQKDDDDKKKLKKTTAALETANKEKEIAGALLAEKTRHSAILQQKNDDLIALLNFRDRENLKLINKIEALTRELETLTAWLDRLEKGTATLFASRQYKTAKALFDLKRKALNKTQAFLPEDYIKDILQRYKNWKEKRN